MKIVIISNDYPRIDHPKYTFVQELVNKFVDMGVNISVIAPQSLTHKLFRKEQLFPREEEYITRKGNKYMVYRPYDFSFGKRFAFITKITDLYCSHCIKNILEKVKPNVLYGHFWHTAYRFKQYAKSKSLPLFVACGEGDNAMEDLVASLGEKRVKDFHDTVTGVVSVSSENARKSITLGLADEKDIIVLPNAVDDELFKPRKSNIRDEFGLKETDFLILFVGVFNNRKGANRLSAAVEKLNNPDIKTIYIGKPIKGDEALPYGNNIIFVGSLNHDQLPDYYNAADIFVLPTQKEGCCNAIVESLACATPVLSANRAFNQDILNIHNSMTFNPDNVNEIASTIYKLINNKVQYQSLKRYCIEHAGDFSINNRAKLIYEFIRQKTGII